VIVSAGALQSPVMFFRAGVGATEALKRAGLLLFTDRSGIDGNLYNYHLLQLVFH
jgi:choline dehydrogenase-like flavoprotein|tara:strand:- start:77 stop:241 length:165 start_codon:yes stop_codon:yes gene_type:complete